MESNADDPETVQQIAIGVVHCQEKFLVGVRASDAVLGGFAEFPGGKCKPGETLEDAVRRECLEETGLTVDVDRLLNVARHKYAHGQLELSFYLCRPTSGECGAPLERFRWVEKWELATLRFPPANAETLQVLAQLSD